MQTLRRSSCRARTGLAGSLSILVTLLALAPTAEGRRDLALGSTTGPILSDGSRYAVTQPKDGVVRVLDFAKRRASSVRLPCGLVDMAARSPALVSCVEPDGTVASRLLDPSSRTVRAIPNAPTGISYNEIGTRWLYGAGPCDSGPLCGYYVNWRTGETFIKRPDAPAHDLNQTQLVALPATETVGLYDRRGRWLLHSEDGGLTLLISRGRKVVKRTTGFAGRPQLSNHAAVWTKGRTVYVYLLRTRSLVTWRSSGVVRAPLPVVAVDDVVLYGVSRSQGVDAGRRYLKQRKVP